MTHYYKTTVKCAHCGGAFEYGTLCACLSKVEQDLARAKHAPPAAASALDTQVGGDHYSKLTIQPIEYIQANKIPFAEGSVIKYVTRWRDKGGVKDLEKARHFLDLLIEFERRTEP